MGVYIDMEMPKEGFVEILIRDDGTVQQTGQSYRVDGTDYYTPYVGEMPKMFTAVAVPAHGRLIDKDVMCNECRRIAEEYDGIYPDCTYCPAHLAPTIIPASEEGE